MLNSIQDFFRRRKRSADLRARFTAVHENNLWGSEESRSGWGSARSAPIGRGCEKAIAKAVA